jgi:hypothetical protein
MKEERITLSKVDGDNLITLTKQQLLELRLEIIHEKNHMCIGV